jgi:hypothetical protein
VVVNRVDYPANFDKVGKSQQLAPDHFSHLDNTSPPTNWCDTSTAHLLADGDTGTPGAPNEQCP